MTNSSSSSSKKLKATVFKPKKKDEKSNELLFYVHMFFFLLFLPPPVFRFRKSDKVFIRTEEGSARALYGINYFSLNNSGMNSTEDFILFLSHK